MIFGRNDLTSDAPISRIDLLLCRNTLMYLNAETQSRMVNRLGFALRPQWRALPRQGRDVAHPPAAFSAPLTSSADSSGGSPADVGRDRGVRRTGTCARHARPRRTTLSGSATRSSMTNPVAQIAVATDGRLAMVNNRAEAMLGLSDRDLGRPFQDLDVSYRPLELRSQLTAVTESRAPVWLREVEWRRTGPDAIYVDVNLVPLLDTSGEVLGVSISFTDVTRFRQLRVEVETANRQLELAYEELQSTNEELETTNEELQTTVEELETTNEELQSTNEELETMNEELQSANDEMQTTNEELRDRTIEITDLNAFMESVMSSLEAAVIVLDRDLVVQVWTPQAQELWGLRHDETVGHHLLNLDSGLPTAELHRWLRSVISGQQSAVVGRGCVQ